MTDIVNTSWLSREQIVCLQAFQSMGAHLPTRALAYKLRDEDRRYAAVKRTAYNVMNNLRARGYAEATLFLNECRWSLTPAGDALRIATLQSDVVG